ncbi:MAG TPA: energy transducer TonB [Clostridia bacterium]|nr:energy transducer TonB [Clostridia bacterium]
MRKWRVVVICFLSTLALISAFVIATPKNGMAQESGRKVKTRINPSYPELARRSRISGTVKFQAVIAPSGQVRTTKLIGGHPLLVGAAEEALKRWKYEPSSEETTIVVEFNFAPS